MTVVGKQKYIITFSRKINNKHAERYGKIIIEKMGGSIFKCFPKINDAVTIPKFVPKSVATIVSVYAEIYICICQITRFLFF